MKIRREREVRSDLETKKESGTHKKSTIPSWKIEEIDEKLEHAWKQVTPSRRQLPFR